MSSTSKPKRPLLKRTWIRILLIVLVLLVAGLWYINPKPRVLLVSDEPMKAIRYHEYGTADVLHLEDTRRPRPNDNQVVIKVRAASVNPLDWHYMRGTPYFVRLVDWGFPKPVDPRLGADVAGEVVAVGKNVTKFKLGDEIFGITGGAFAEYAPVTQTRAVLKPANLTFEQAAAVPVAAVTALQALRDKGQIRAGQKVLINGAAGGVGTFTVQLAKSFGAEVTGVCSTRNLELVRSLGADHVIDYTKEDFTQGTQKYDLIVDNVGNRALSDNRRVMAPKGIYVGVGGGGPDAGGWIGPLAGPIKALVYAPFVSQQFLSFIADVNVQDLGMLKQMLEAKQLRPVIDRTFPLSEVPAAVRYLEEGHARGKVVVTVKQDN